MNYTYQKCTKDVHKMRYEPDIFLVQELVEGCRQEINPEMRRQLANAIQERLAIAAYDLLYTDRLETKTYLYTIGIGKDTGIEGWRSFEVRRCFGERYVCCGVYFDEVYLSLSDLPPLMFMPQPFVVFYGWGVFTGNQQAMNVKVRDLNEF